MTPLRVMAAPKILGLLFSLALLPRKRSSAPEPPLPSPKRKAEQPQSADFSAAAPAYLPGASLLVSIIAPVLHYLLGSGLLTNTAGPSNGAQRARGPS